ncbi:MAG TPA: hypothetical protein VF143_07955 [Candidatus Nanopelagicales bacterium]
MKIRRSARISTVVLVLGAIATFLTGVVGFVNSTVVNGSNFAGIVNDVRGDDAVKTQIGRAIGAAAVDADPDLVAIQPAIDAGAAAIIGSPLLDPVFTPAIRQFHGALTQEGGGQAVLAVADLGATATTALQTFVPGAADLIPENLNLTLARIGGQEGIAAQIIPLISVISTLAWVLPLVSIGLFALGVLLAPRRRIALVRLGWMVLVAGGFLGLLTLALGLMSAFTDASTLTGAVAAAAMAQFAQPLGVRFIATVVIGGLMVAAAGALLPQVDLTGHLRTATGWLTRRPTSPGLAVARSLGIIAAGVLIVLFPTASTQLVAIAAGLAVLFIGVTELDMVAERTRAADEAEAAQRALAELPGAQPEELRRSRGRWLIPVGAAVVGVAVMAMLILPDHLPQDEGYQTVSVNADACNGHVELCDVPFDQVVIPASHNSMSIADGTWFLAEQPKDMVESLDDGIRGLLVDTWYGQATDDGRAITGPTSLAAAERELVETYGQSVADSVQRTIDRVRRAKVIGDEQPFFCHTVCELGATPMAPTMQRLNTWMDNHPRDVVVLFIQDTVSPADTAAVLQQAGLVDKAYVHPAGADWPTLRQMVDSNKRLVVLMENEGGGSQYPYLHQGFDLVQDTEYTFDSAADFTCTLKRGKPDSPLLSINHWLASFQRLVSNAEEVNAYPVLRARVDECLQERGRKPSMIAVNWYDKGDLFRVVDELNGVG